MALTRKRKRNADGWSKNVVKRDRYKPAKLLTLPTCRHEKKKVLCCHTLKMQDIRRFHQAFYASHKKIDQDNFILKNTERISPRRSSHGERSSTVSISYFIPLRNRGRVQVCAKAFLNILGVSKFRVQNISKHYMVDGQSPKERRGGDRLARKYNDKRESVCAFLNGLEFVETRYTRERSTRKYLPSDCTVTKLWQLHNSSVSEDKRVKYSYFLHIFNHSYNISFKSPATDACSLCIQLNSKLKVAQTQALKVELMGKIRVHKLKANTFYALLKQKEEPSVLKMSFNCQKNLVLPKVPDQSAYHSRQLYLYNFTICVGSSTSPQGLENVFMYTWYEHQRSKGSNEIASILFYHLSNTDMSGITEIKLFCDGCPGQNKNMTVIGMLSKWLRDSATDVSQVTMTFPVVGHSFLPADRVFGRIERKLKRMDTIVQPEQYLEIFQQFGTVRKVSEIPVNDWKEAVSLVYKPAGQLHFKFAPSKRFIIQKQCNRSNNIVVRGEVHYRSNLGDSKSLCKKGKSLDHIRLEILPSRVHVKPEKLRDVGRLLEVHFGEEWRQIEMLGFYRDVLDGERAENPGDGDILTEEQEMEYFEESDELRV
ncbi:transposon protein [Nesidiocoris tenuis]|uniref:Transposon protein n=1 Tax=Nesidiocoris tenuis TaxID=355587 RepID=A0ABN7ACV7_9HEMI|nr:transposon protein [Nesidiocoris tenuis]